MPLAADGAVCWALRTGAATITAVAKQSGKAIFFSSLGSPFQEYYKAGSEGDTGTCGVVKMISENSTVSVLRSDAPNLATLPEF
jgi:hypothetical protein